MPARYSRISSRTSSTLSFTTYLVPSTRKATVSGWPSTRSIRSGLSANRSPFKRVTRITGRSSCSMGPARTGGEVSFLFGSPACFLEPNSRGPVPHGGQPGRGGLPPGARHERADGGAEGGPHSALEVDQVLQDLVGGGDHAAVGLEAALGDDEAGELLGEVDVGHLQSAGVEHAAPTDAGQADGGRTGVDADAEGRAAGLLQAAGVAERGQGELPDGLAQAVGVDAGDGAVVAELEGLQRAEGVAVLAGRRDGARPTELGQRGHVNGDRTAPAGERGSRRREGRDGARCGG